MKYIIKNIRVTMTNQSRTMSNCLSGIFLTGLFLFSVSCSQTGQPRTELEASPALNQATFTSAEEADNTFELALKNNDIKLLQEILGANYQEVLPVDTVSNEGVQKYIAAWEKEHVLLADGDKKRLIAVGVEQWVMPIPIVLGESGWYFDIQEGLERMRIRRIGRNELSAIQAVLAYYDAQKEYAELDHNNDGVLEYAQKFISTSGERDGLYWENNSENTLSPLGPLFAERIPEKAYHGYYYKILTAQGEHAKGGAYSYLQGNNMKLGFALLAWPEEYGESGVISFLVSHEGVVYEQDLGRESASVAENISTFNPSSNWKPVDEVDNP